MNGKDWVVRGRDQLYSIKLTGPISRQLDQTLSLPQSYVVSFVPFLLLPNTLLGKWSGGWRFTIYVMIH